MKKIEKQIETYLDWCKNVRKLSPVTMERRKCFFRYFLNEVPAQSLQQLSNQMIEDFVRNGNWTGSTTNEYIVEIKTMLRFFKKRGERLRHINLEQIVRVKETPRRKVFYTREQIDEVLDDCDELEWLLIRLCFDCGFRIHELAALRLENIDGRKVAFIGKGRKIRETYMSHEARKRLDEWIEDQGITDYLWVKHYKGAPAKARTKESLSAIMRGAFYRNGYTDFHPHALRHSFATEICRNGAPLEVAKEMLGHANIQTTMRYVHSLEGHLEEMFIKYRYNVAAH